MSIAAFIDLQDDRRDLAIELAVTLAEFSIEENLRLYLLTDAIAALEIGMSLIGLRNSRTVEGGEYRASPIQLLPFIPRPKLQDDEYIREGREEADSDRGGGISELFDLGVFARKGEGEGVWREESNPEEALFQVIKSGLPRYFIGLGKDSPFWSIVENAEVKSMSSGTLSYIIVDGFGPELTSERRESIFVEPAELSRTRSEGEISGEIEEYEEHRRAAEQEGALVAGFLDVLVKQVRG